MVTDLGGKLARYVVTGGTAAVVDAVLFVSFVRFGLPIGPAAAVSFCISAWVNYRLTSRFVFGRKPTHSGFGLFMAAALVGVTINVLVTLAGVHLLGWPALGAKLLGTGTAFLANFALNSFVVFWAPPVTSQRSPS